MERKNTQRRLAKVGETCLLCPRRCGVDRARGERGLCGAPHELTLARAALHRWEEPLLCTGAGSGTVFFSFCPLRCVYCQNADVSSGRVAFPVTDRRLARIFLELQEANACNINLVTPTQYVPEIARALREAKKSGLDVPVVYNTSGYELPETLEYMKGLVDVYLTDFKYWDSAAAKKYSAAPDYREYASKALDAMVDQVGSIRIEATSGGEASLVRGVVVRHLLLPGRLADAQRIVRYVDGRYGNAVRLSLMWQYTPCGDFTHCPELSQAVEKADYDALLDYADSLGIDDYFWQVERADAASFIPVFDGTGV